MKKQGFTAFLRRKQYVIAGAIVAIAAVGTTMFYSNEQEQERQQLEAELAAEMKEQEMAAAENKTQEETEAAQAASAVIPPKTEPEKELEIAEIEGVTEEKAEEIAKNGADDTAEMAEAETGESEEMIQTAKAGESLHFVPEEGMLWPMEGDVILNYSMDATVYFATLEQYKYNPAVIIAGEVNDKVYSVAKGQVADIANNEVTGCTVTVDLGDGYQAIYGQLKEVNFAVGDYVESGHVLGYVAEPTKYFSVEGSNLYFELQKDGVPVNPVEFFD